VARQGGGRRARSPTEAGLRGQRGAGWVVVFVRCRRGRWLLGGLAQIPSFLLRGGQGKGGGAAALAVHRPGGRLRPRALAAGGVGSGLRPLRPVALVVGWPGPDTKFHPACRAEERRRR